MNTKTPPRWLERLLLLFLAPRDRESISGDLLEEYREEQLPRGGPLRANLWYLRQLTGFAFNRISGGPRMKQALMVLCFFVMTAGAWLCLMENVLQHDGYIVRSVVALLIAAQGLTTLLVVRRGGHAISRTLVAIGAVGAALFGTSAIVTTLRARHFEGFVLLIGLALIVEGILALLVLSRPGQPSGLRSI